MNQTHLLERARSNFEQPIKKPCMRFGLGSRELRLREGSRPPVVHRSGISPEVFLLGGYASGGNVSLRDSEGFVIAGDRIAVGPIASEEDAIFAEELPEFVERSMVIAGIQHCAAIYVSHNLKSFDEDISMFGEFTQIPFVLS
jgi:hypothetical protein